VIQQAVEPSKKLSFFIIAGGSVLFFSLTQIKRSCNDDPGEVPKHESVDL
jgi:hypothetical protein